MTYAPAGLPRLPLWVQAIANHDGAHIEGREQPNEPDTKQPDQ
jgi:hypothetical protein